MVAVPSTPDAASALAMVGPALYAARVALAWTIWAEAIFMVPPRPGW